MWLYHSIAKNKTFFNLSFKYSSKYFLMQNNYIAPKITADPWTMRIWTARLFVYQYLQQ